MTEQASYPDRIYSLYEAGDWTEDEGSGDWIAPATEAQIRASDQTEDGIFLIDGTGTPLPAENEGQPWVAQPVRRVYVDYALGGGPR